MKKKGLVIIGLLALAAVVIIIEVIISNSKAIIYTAETVKGSAIITPDDVRLTARHEAGHCVVDYYFKGEIINVYVGSHQSINDKENEYIDYKKKNSREPVISLAGKTICKWGSFDKTDSVFLKNHLIGMMAGCVAAEMAYPQKLEKIYAGLGEVGQKGSDAEQIEKDINEIIRLEGLTPDKSGVLKVEARNKAIDILTENKAAWDEISKELAYKGILTGDRVKDIIEANREEGK